MNYSCACESMKASSKIVCHTTKSRVDRSVCICVCLSVTMWCVSVCLSGHIFLPPCTSKHRNIGTCGFIITAKTSFVYLECHQIYWITKIWIQKFGYHWNLVNVCVILLFTIFNKNSLFRTYTYVPPWCAYIGNINMHMYITSAHGHELSGCALEIIA